MGSAVRFMRGGMLRDEVGSLRYCKIAGNAEMFYICKAPIYRAASPTRFRLLSESDCKEIYDEYFEHSNH